MISLFITNGMYLSFYILLCPAQSLLYVYPLWVLSQYDLEALLIFFHSFMCRKLALNRENVLHFRCSHRCLGQVYGGLDSSRHLCVSVWTSVIMFIHLSGHLYICQYIQKSLETLIHPYVYLWDMLGDICVFVRHCVSVSMSVCVSVVCTFCMGPAKCCRI